MTAVTRTGTQFNHRTTKTTFYPQYRENRNFIQQLPDNSNEKWCGKLTNIISHENSLKGDISISQVHSTPKKKVAILIKSKMSIAAMRVYINRHKNRRLVESEPFSTEIGGPCRNPVRKRRQQRRGEVLTEAKASREYNPFLWMTMNSKEVKWWSLSSVCLIWAGGSKEKLLTSKHKIQISF